MTTTRPAEILATLPQDEADGPERLSGREAGTEAANAILAARGDHSAGARAFSIAPDTASGVSDSARACDQRKNARATTTGTALRPEDVFTPATLRAWAVRHGMVDGDVLEARQADLAAAQREAAALRADRANAEADRDHARRMLALKTAAVVRLRRERAERDR